MRKIYEVEGAKYVVPIAWRGEIVVERAYSKSGEGYKTPKDVIYATPDAEGAVIVYKFYGYHDYSYMLEVKGGEVVGENR